MKPILATLILFFSGFGLKADSLWVHHIGVGQGDATLIVAWQTNATGGVDTTSVLIDAGNSSGKGNAVYNYVNEVLGARKRLNFVITSHLHSDHIGGMPVVLQRLRENNWNVNFIIDRGATNQPLPDICYGEGGPDEDNDPIEPVSLPSSGIYATYEGECNSVYYNGKRSNIAPGNDLFRALNRPANMSMMCVVSNGCVLTQYNSPVYNCPANPNPDENDFSFGFLLQFEGFKYFTAGDLGGGGEYLDLETPLIPYFNSYNVTDFHFCGYKASHHGSGNSNNQAFLTYSQPQLIVIPSALRSFSGRQLPWQSAVERMQAVPGNYMTYTYHYLTNPYSGAVDYYFDVKFKVSNPGVCAPIGLPVYRRSRAKTSPYAPISAFALLNNYTCAEPHNPPGAPCVMQEKSTADTSGKKKRPKRKKQQAEIKNEQPPQKK